MPTPRPELQSLLVRARFFKLARQLNAWAVKMRRHRLLLLWEAVRGFFLASPVDGFKDLRSVAWFRPGFVRRNRVALCGYPHRLKLYGPLPNFQNSICTLNGDQRQLAFYGLRLDLLRDLRYPYLDRNFLEFMFAIPQEQVVGVGKRRYLMKRAMVGIIPGELLDRRRKAFAPPETRKHRSTEWPSVVETEQHINGSYVRIIDRDRLAEALQTVRRNEEVPIESLTKTWRLESWLSHLTTQGALTNIALTNRRTCLSAPDVKKVRASVQSKSSAS